jgi:uncharacterized protein YqhQ
MRGVATWSVAVRRPDGQVEVTTEALEPWARRHPVLRWPVVRGMVALAESLGIGFRALGISANAQLEEGDGQEPEQIGGFAWVMTIVISSSARRIRMGALALTCAPGHAR